MTGHKAEAIKALQQVVAILGNPEPLSGLQKFQVKATAEYAMAEITAIQELKRARRDLPAGQTGDVEIDG